ncbi:MAG: vitamin K epoxide reductase, partial [Dehalococcoidia bacterium]
MGIQSLVKTPDPGRLSHELRTSDDPFLARRRQVVARSLLSSASMGLIAAYQIGLIRRVPEPRLPLLDADKVDLSEEAYQMLSTGDAFLG